MWLLLTAIILQSVFISAWLSLARLKGIDQHLSVIS